MGNTALNYLCCCVHFVDDDYFNSINRYNYNSFCNISRLSRIMLVSGLSQEKRPTILLTDRTTTSPKYVSLDI